MRTALLPAARAWLTAQTENLCCQTLANGTPCNNSIFGDPDLGVVKACFTSGQGPSGYTFCANENANCSFTGSQSVAYGADGKFVFQTLANGTPCNNSIFGDPDLGVVKACFTSGQGPSGYTFCANENANCSFTGSQSVAYGADGKFVFQPLANGTPCNNDIFGDPDFGVVKACYIKDVATLGDGSEYNQHTYDIVRFLQQASFGPTFSSASDPTSVAHVDATGFEAWLNEQFSTPALYPNGSDYQDLTFVASNPDPTCIGTCLRDNYSMYPLQMEFYQNALTGPDQLRQRVAFALSQIFVVSAQEATLNKGSWMTPYLQTLDRDAFGNFRTLLYDITLNPAMGRYLNTLGNVKSAPNENYGREVLQLFTIGLNELNMDGTPQIDSHGNPIPSYDQPTVTDFARAFTGWNLAAPLSSGILNYHDPMVANENLHDRNAKQLLTYPGAAHGGLLPAGQSAETDLNDALDNIFNHPNVGPFIGTLLIRHLVTSNPSPAYVSRVAQVFNDNGAGVRGDLKAVITAILLDPEARSDSPAVTFGHAMEPVLFITTALRAFGVASTSTDFVLGESFLTPGEPVPLTMGQDLFLAPSVFNYYPAGYVLPGTRLTAPEFFLLTTSTSLARANFIELVVYRKMPMNTNRPLGTWLDLAFLESLATGDGSTLVSELNLRLLHGAISDSLKATVLAALAKLPATNSAQQLARVQEAVYLIATSAEFQVRR